MNETEVIIYGSVSDDAHRYRSPTEITDSMIKLTSVAGQLSGQPEDFVSRPLYFHNKW